MCMWMYNINWNFNTCIYVYCCRCSGPLMKRVYTCNGIWFDGSAVRAEIQTYRLYILWDFGYLTEKICVRGQQCTWQWTSYKHFDITRQKNVGGGRLARVGWGRGWETVARTGLQWKIYVSERAAHRWLGLRTRPHTPRALTPPPRQISKKTQKYDRNIEADLSLVFSYTRVRQCSPIGYMIGYIINIWNIINIGFFLPHEDVCIADL
jgi:hypothetical protein